MGSIANLNTTLNGLRKYIVVIGGSYVGTKAAESLAVQFHKQYRVLLIDKNSHFQHLFAFPRFAVTNKVNTHKAFIPYGPHTFGATPQDSGSFVQARVIDLTADSVRLDRKVAIDGQPLDTIPYVFLVLATGTKLSPPSSMPGFEKLDGVSYLQKHAELVMRSNRIVVIGGGAVGVQIALDMKELYPEKSITLVHSRKNVMNKFDSRFHDLIADRFAELGVVTKLGSRVKLPAKGYPTEGREFQVELQDGSSVPADFVIVATGQTPNSDILSTLSPKSIGEDKFIRVAPTLQISDTRYPNVFALGDVAATAAHKAARPAMKQVEIVTKNIQHQLDGTPMEEYQVTDPAALHLTLGITKSVIFRNPVAEGGEPMIMWKDDGRLDMGIDDVWKRRGGGLDHML
jgi:apoptosis-inducing factor 2